MKSIQLRRAAGRLGLVACALLLGQGCAQVIHVAPPDYPAVPGRGSAQISTRDGRVYDFNDVSVDSSRFLGQVDVVRNVVTRDGHVDAVEGTEWVRVPFEQVLNVSVRKSDPVGTAFLVGAAVGALTLLVRAFQPADQPAGGGTTPPPGPDKKGQRH